MLLFVCRKATSFNPVKLETSLTVILPPPLWWVLYCWSSCSISSVQARTFSTTYLAEGLTHSLKFFCGPRLVKKLVKTLREFDQNLAGRQATIFHFEVLFSSCSLSLWVEKILHFSRPFFIWSAADARVKCDQIVQFFKSPSWQNFWQT